MALEAVPVSCAGGRFLLECGGVDHHGDGFVGIEVGFAILAGQSEKGVLGLLNLAFTDEPPRRFGSEKNTDNERDRPHPLESVRDSVRPLVVPFQHRHDNTDSNFLTDTPAEIDVCCEVATHGDGADFRGICNGECLEDTPRLHISLALKPYSAHRQICHSYNSTQNLSRKQRLDVLSCKK